MFFTVPTSVFSRVGADRVRPFQTLQRKWGHKQNQNTEGFLLKIKIDHKTYLLTSDVSVDHSSGGWKEDSNEVFSNDPFSTRRAFSLNRHRQLYAFFAEDMTTLC